MKKQFRLFSIVVSFFGILLTASAALAAPPQPPNIRVLLSGPNSAQVGSPYVYTVNVRNIGGSTASGVRVIVDLPETNTSPQKYILGTLSGIDSRCQIVSRKLNCQLGSITHSGQNQVKEFTFNLALPVSTRTLSITATGSSTSSNEANAQNNVATITPTPAYAANQLTSANVLVSMCTGRGLSSFFECELFPGSQQHITLSLNADYSVSYSGQTVGSWDQFVSPQQLHMTLSDGNGTAEFNGFAVNNTCFEGLTTFLPDNGYVSPYKVCVQ